MELGKCQAVDQMRRDTFWQRKVADFHQTPRIQVATGNHITLQQGDHFEHVIVAKANGNWFLLGFDNPKLRNEPP
jgi:hypothetical protein